MNSQQAYLDRIRECFPDLSISDVSMADGHDNVAVMVDNNRVFRFPKHEAARKQVAREAKVLQLIRPRVDMRVPVFDHCEEDFVAYEMIPGAPLYRVDILEQDGSVQDGLAEQLATFLRQLHTIPMGELEKHDVSKSYATHCYAVWIRQFRSVQLNLFPHMTTSVQECIKRHYEFVMGDREFMNYQPVLVYGDVSPKHVLYDKLRKMIAGVIDFGVAGIGDPAIDFAWIINYYGESFLRRMQAFYPEIKGAVERARFLVGTFDLAWALSASKSEGVSKWRSFALSHVVIARDAACIGSGWPNDLGMAATNDRPLPTSVISG